MRKNTTIKTYSELISLPTFEDRFKYLQLKGSVGRETFGFDRYLNQALYRSPEWKRVRNFVIDRDRGCDLGIEDRAIMGRVLIHHMNPISMDDIISRMDYVLDPEYLISTTHSTHNAIHYGDEQQLISSTPVIRTKNDMCPWKH